MQSSSFTSEDHQEDEDLKCPKCLSFFSSETKPYILPCNHNICLNCINLLISENKSQCPICAFKFSKKDKNSFEVNFTFLNIIIKILKTKIIFCTKCNKIFYWKDHHQICEQKYFQNCDDILEEIKNNCEESIKIIKLIKENGNLINKYKNEIDFVTKNITKEIRKKYITNIRTNFNNELFDNKIDLNIDFNKAKNDMINFIQLFVPYNEHFNINDEIKSIIMKNNYDNFNNNALYNSYTEIKINTKSLKNKKDSLSPPLKNLIFSGKKYQTISNNSTDNSINLDNNNINSSTNIDIRKKLNNKINKFLNYKMNKNLHNKKNIVYDMYEKNKKEIISEEKEGEDEFTLLSNINNSNIDDEGINETERVKIKKYHDNNISQFEKLNKAQVDINNNKNINILNKKIMNNTIDIINKENNNNSIIRKNLFNSRQNKKTLISINQNNQSNHKKSKTKFDIKSLLKEDFEDDENTKNKIIIGLKDVKVISLKQSGMNIKNEKLGQKNKINSKLLKTKMKINNNKKINLGNINNLINKNKNHNIGLNKNNKNQTEDNDIEDKLTKTINIEGPSLNLLRSSEFSKREYRFNVPINKNKNKNKNNINSNLSFSSTNIDFNTISQTSKNLNVINHSSMNESLSLKNKQINSYFNVPQKNSTFVNDKMLKNFNKIKEITSKLKKYYELILFLSDTININVNQNISLLNNIIINNYELLLNNISFKSIHSQKNFILTFLPNTYNILLFDSFNKKFNVKNMNKIFQKNKLNIKQFNLSNSIIFDDNDLIYISGGENSYDLFLIISLSKEDIIYNKSMPIKRAYHKTIFINNKLYLIGGEDINKKVTQECYYFNNSEKKWHFFPNLKKPRKNFSLCLYNESVLYIFMGEDNIKILDTIEYIDINTGNKKGWSIFRPIDMGYVWHPLKNILAINIDKDKIIICGGEDSNKNLYKDCFLFKPSNFNVYKGIDLKVPASFISEGCFSHDEIFGIDYKNISQNQLNILHKFNINNTIWNWEYINNIN